MSEAEASAGDGSGKTTQETQTALVEAKGGGERVEVDALRTEYATTFANPDGVTLTLEDSAVPVRVRTSSGGWTAPDATLEVRSDGTVGPKAAAVDLSFSGGGQGSGLVRIERDGRSLALGWPGELPEPALDGTSALYPEVLDGVDLRLTASVEGFREVLIVKTAEAAASDELKKIVFSLRTSGVEVRETAAGGMAAVDSAGTTVFQSPMARMWDSAGKSAASAAYSPQLVTSAEAEEPTGAETVDSGAVATEDPASGPSDGDALAALPLEVTDNSVALVPDADLLEGATFPLYIDPPVTWGESERTLLRSDGYTDYAWDNGDDDEGKGMGYCGTYVTGGYAYYCGSGYKQRLYFEFSPSQLTGKKVLDATFRVTESWSMSCTASWVNLVRTNGISSSTDWAGPTALDLMGDRNVSAGRGSACDPSQPNAAIEFNDNPDESNENLTPTVQSFAAGKFSRLTLMLQAQNESDPNSWKRFKNDAVLAVDYVGVPAKPTGIGIVTGDGTVCETDAADPAIVSDPTPSLAATAQTASGGESGASLRAYFDVDAQDSAGTWADATAGNGNLRPSSGYAGDNAKVTLAWSTLSENVLYRYRAWTRSYYNSGSSWLSSASNASTTGWCHFKVDPTRPLKPKIAVGSPYSECTANACVAGGGPEVKATFTFSPADGDTRNVAYQYKLSTDTAWSSEISGKTVSASITPDLPGTYRLYVRAKDSLGRWGAQNLVDFLVKEGTGPVGQWHFDESSGDAIDSSTTVTANQDNAALSASGASRNGRGRLGTDRGTGVEDTALALDGSSGYAATSSAVLETRSSYTVSAWVRLDDLSKDAVVLSQDGSQYSPFYLAYDSGVGLWLFGMTSGDSSTGLSAPGVAMNRPVIKGAWTHLMGVYNATAKTMRLYIDGRYYTQGTAPTAWAATGRLEMGRGLWAGAQRDAFTGGIDEVRVWQRALTVSEVLREGRLLDVDGWGHSELVASWDAATAVSGSTTLTDASGYGRNLTLSGGAATDGQAMVLDGTNDAATASDAVVDDIASFTVTALVEPDLEALAKHDVGYVAQVIGKRDKNNASNWGLFYELTGKDTIAVETSDGDIVEKTVAAGLWHFGRINADGTLTSQASEEAVTTSGAIRLTGVYNAQDSSATLYLGATQQFTPVSYTTNDSPDQLTVGRGYSSGAWGHYLPGSVNEVRLWAGAMTGTEQIATVIGD
ncbi:LamG-like jellyroll fold domain-containing protein [Streptomyces sp. NPDC058676]|uniref:LamG-like jellyroll fold domain-containing protein n=1 Tax=unclassified Streptomyces TaxID=2593676 RepID=UPI003650A4B4